MPDKGSECRMPLDSGLVVVIIICMMYMVLVFGLLFYVKNEWCDLLFKNYTASRKPAQTILKYHKLGHIDGHW